MKEKLHHTHLSILIYMTQTAVVILSLPRTLAESFGTNGWLALIPASLLAMFNIYLISLVFNFGEGQSIYQILELTISKIILYPVYMILALVWTLLGCMVGKEYVLIFQMIAFPTTHPMSFKFAMDILVFLLLVKGIYNISKASTTFFVLVFWMLLLLLAFIPEFKWVRLTPHLFHGGTNTLQGFIDTYSAFGGYELSLLPFPYVETKTKFLKAVTIGNLITTMTYILVCFVSFGFYSFGQLTNMVFPMIDLLAYIEFPFVERIENLLFGFLLFTSLITVVMYSWAAKETLLRIFPRANTNRLSVIILITAYCISFIPDVLGEVHNWLRILANIALSIAFGLPLFLLLLLIIQKSRKEPPENA